jgi:class 3 adenylate cyclase
MPVSVSDAVPVRAGLNLRIKILLAMAVVALVVVGAILFTDYHARRRQLLSEFQIFVKSVAGTTALALRGEDLAGIRSNADAASPEFRRVREILARSQAINGLSEQELYILRPLADGREMEFVVMVQRETFIGNRYSIREENLAALTQAWQRLLPTSTGVYRDEHGSWISGYAPILDAAQRPVAIIEADAEISRYVRKQRDELLFALTVAGGALVVAMVPGLLLARGITGGLNRLSDGMRRFQSGAANVRVEARSRDEVGQLAAVFNDMIVGLEEKLALLPYVSRFTAEAVRRSREQPELLTGAEADVHVLFADLRGFTRFSEERAASVLVRELNQLLSVQADVVLGAGGDVDKFIGDAVMAVFLEQSGAAARVFECAQRLMARVREEVERQGWPLALGIGIHRGRAVVGSIGSASRRDFTAIGHTVNLAARLCEHAAPWEILISADFHAALPAGAREAFTATEPMHFKNVAQHFTTFRSVAGLRETSRQ